MIYFGEWMNVSVVRGGALLLPYSSFLALMQEKKAKENQGIRDASQVFIVPGRGVLHTPYRRSIYGTMNHDNWHGSRIRHPWDGV